jgi:hypothetical protein
MSRVLIVSPHFPPINAPDMQRVRMSMHHYSEFGWNPVVLTVDARYVEGVLEPLLNKTVPSDVPIHHVRSLPSRFTRRLGFSSLALRSLPFLYVEGLRLIEQYKIDLICFSTTLFPAPALGRIWKNRSGVPFVIDMQDPWFTTYYQNKSNSERPPKYWLSNLMNRYLEKWTMKEVDGIISVSNDYIATLKERYPRIGQTPADTITFGISESDFEIMNSNDLPNPFFLRTKNRLNGVYVGRLGTDMVRSLTILFETLRKGLAENPKLFSKLRIHFVGTDYAPAYLARKTAEPLAKKLGVEKFIYEQTNRVQYFESLKILADSDFLIILGSDDPQYMASKIFPYIMAKKPLLGVFHENSSVVEIVKKTRAGEIVSTNARTPVETYVKQLLPLWINMLLKIPYEPDTDWEQFKPYTARELTKRQCYLFDLVIKSKSNSRH